MTKNIEELNKELVIPVANITDKFMSRMTPLGKIVYEELAAIKEDFDALIRDIYSEGGEYAYHFRREMISQSMYDLAILVRRIDTEETHFWPKYRAMTIINQIGSSLWDCRTTHGDIRGLDYFDRLDDISERLHEIQIPLADVLNAGRATDVPEEE